MNTVKRAPYVVDNLVRVLHPRYVALATVTFGSTVIDVAVTAHHDAKMNQVFALRELGVVVCDPRKPRQHPLDEDAARDAVLNELLGNLAQRAAVLTTFDEVGARRKLQR